MGRGRRAVDHPWRSYERLLVEVVDALNIAEFVNLCDKGRRYLLDWDHLMLILRRSAERDGCGTLDLLWQRLEIAVCSLLFGASLTL